MAERDPDRHKSSSPSFPPSIEGKENLPVTTIFDLSLSPPVDGDAEVKEQSTDDEESNVPIMPSSGSHQTTVYQEPVRGLAKKFTGEVSDDTRKEIKLFGAPVASHESSPREASNVFEKDLEFQDQEMAEKTVHGVGLFGPGHSSETPLSLNSSGAVVRDAKLKDDYESNVTNLTLYSSHQTTVSEQGIRGLGKEIDRGISSDTSNEFWFPILPDSYKEEAGDGRQENLEFQDQERLKSRAHAAGLQDSSDELANTIALSPRLNQQKKASMRKRLTKSDVDSCSRLILHKKEVLQVLPLMDPTTTEACNSEAGAEVEIFDPVEGKETTLTLKFYEGQSRLQDGWRNKFVMKKNLKVGDEIELAWDKRSKKFNFAVIRRAGDSLGDFLLGGIGNKDVE